MLAAPKARLLNLRDQPLPTIEIARLLLPPHPRTRQHPTPPVPSRPHTGESPQTNGVVERFFGTLKYEHLYRATICDGNALAVEVNLFRHTYNALRPHQALDERTPRAAYLAVEHRD